MEEVNTTTPEKKADDSPINIEKIKNYLLQYYLPSNNINETDFHLSTNEIYESLFSVFPFPDLFRMSDIALWLHEGGYKFADFGEMRFKWLFKRNP
jgi:hypothetical protein